MRNGGMKREMLAEEKGGEMKGERRDDKEAERKGDVPLGGSHR